MESLSAAGSRDPAAFLRAGPARLRDVFVEGRLATFEARWLAESAPAAVTGLSGG